MEDKAREISARLLNYSTNIIKICIKLDRISIGKHIGRQLLRSGTSVGANYEEACGAQSRADFIHKMQIVLKEIRESLYWLKLIKKSEILKEEDTINVINETQQISNIIGKSIITARENKQ